MRNKLRATLVALLLVIGLASTAIAWPLGATVTGRQMTSQGMEATGSGTVVYTVKSILTNIGGIRTFCDLAWRVSYVKSQVGANSGG